MNPRQKFEWLMAGIATLLAVATVVGWILGAKVRTESGRSVIANLNTRIAAWWVMVAVFGVAYVFGKIATIVLFAVISFLSLREFITLTPTRPADHRALSVAFFVIIPVQYYLIGIEWYALFTIFIPVYAFLLLPSLSMLGQDTEQFLERTAKIQWGVFVTVFCISHAPALLLLRIPGYAGQDALLLFYLILIVQISDVLQYVFGKLFGKHPVASVVSPSKTVEGLVGGASSAIGVGCAMWWITPFSPVQAAAMASVIVLAGFLGGLVLSAVKRSMGAKDWGSMISGHGGMLDRMDSISFAAPIFFHLTRFFFAH